MSQTSLPRFGKFQTGKTSETASISFDRSPWASWSKLARLPLPGGFGYREPKETVEVSKTWRFASRVEHGSLRSPFYRLENNENLCGYSIASSKSWAMKDESKAGLQLAPGILRAALGLGLLSVIVATPLPAQLSIGRPGFTPVPPAKTRPTPQTKPARGSTSNADKRLAETIQNLTPKQRKN